MEAKGIVLSQLRYPVTVLRKAVALLRRSNTKARGDEQMMGSPIPIVFLLVTNFAFDTIMQQPVHIHIQEPELFCAVYFFLQALYQYLLQL